MISVTSVILKNAKRQEKKNTLREKMLSFIAFSIVFLSLAISMIVVSYYVISKFQIINQEFTYINVLLLMNFLILFTKSVFECINSLYFSKNLKILLRMPIKSRDIVHAKLVNMIVSEYQMEFIMLAIPMTIYGILTNVNIFFYLYSVIILLIMPVIPIIISSLIISIIMRFTNIIKDKTQVMYIAIILTILIIGALSSGISGNVQITSVADFQNAVMNANGIAKEIANQSVFIRIIMDILINYKTEVGLLNLFIYLGTSLIIYITGLLIISKLYLKGAIGTTINSQNAKGKKLTLTIDDFRVQDKKISYLKKELKIMARTPIFFIQCLIIPILYPLAIFMVFVVAVTLSKIVGIDIIKNFMEIINNPKGQAAFLGVADIFFMMNFCSIIGISKEGKSSLLLKTIPMGLYRQFNLRIFIGRMINMFSAIIITISYGYAMRNIFFTCLIFLILFLMDGLGEKAKLLIDLEKPKIKWDNEYTMMKEHTNVLYVLFYTLIMLGLIVLIGFIMKSVISYLLIILAIYLFSNLIVNNYIRKNKGKIFSKIY